ncbi:hypothetical protein NI35_3445 [Salmonella enterica subsp. enterica serovar Cerro]|uniref:Uncharacterized protein n=1 Tax=Salmonella enterica subsp. enterica serovar Adelaide str. A4-669 TaxID=913063 RepID=A0A6C8GNQ4_SALET|nr:hypothetical protein GW13_PRO0554 [Salmonella enterica subsp. enterica serovar Cerro]EHC37004.1 hypothetical protein LTSEADE_2261 [Salmonella enterica subsp. enterica serovar Adelaide str. A4-669]KMN28763.1 hypothetical protein NI35_3445 [Salmonella enterica subsp. enterica serovar Cerro]QDQ32328.1 hypothetical protein FORC098_2452 [Salmonella enterica subsp. enterica serovar Typhimurium]VXG73861.1 hypothetical protein CDS [Salmonella enterica subsp. enterica serovar Derby]
MLSAKAEDDIIPNTIIDKPIFLDNMLSISCGKVMRIIN